MLIKLLRGLPFLASALLFAAGCDDEAGGIPIACTGPQACPPPSTLIGWAAQLWPSSSDSNDAQHPLAPQETAQLQFDAGGTGQLQYRTPAKTQGTLMSADMQPLVQGRVLAILPTLIPGQSMLSFNTLSADKPPGKWTLRVPVPEHPSAQPYRFWVGFDDANLASLYPPVWQDSVITGDVTLPLIMRAPSELATVYGRITDPLGQGVGGLTVQVLDSANQIVSSTAISQGPTGQTPGSYTLFVDPTLSSDPLVNLRVVVRPASASSSLPTLEVSLPQPRVGTTTPVLFAFPSQRTPVSFQLPVRGAATSGTVTSIVGAHVQAQVQLQDQMTIKLGVRAIYTATADTDAQGIARLMLAPAPSGGNNLGYKVTVTSPTLAPFASMQQEVAIGPNEGVLTPLTLPLRAQLLGRLLDAAGQPVPNAQVVAQAIAGSGPTPNPLDNPVADVAGPQTTTDADGHFALSLDPGDYDLDLVPVPGTQPRSSLDNQRIGAADLDVGEIHLPGITLGRLLVTRPGGGAVKQTKVRIFQLADTTPRTGLACVASAPCSRTAKLRAEAVTDGNGLAQFLLPASVPALTP